MAIKFCMMANFDDDKLVRVDLLFCFACFCHVWKVKLFDLVWQGLCNTNHI